MRVIKGASIALLLGTGAASAATFDALPTVSDNNGRTVNLWFDNLLATGANSVFGVTDPGTMIFEDDGTASLDVSAYDAGSPADGFQIEATFGAAPDGSEYKNLFDLPDETGPIDLYSITTGTLTGLGGWAGLVMEFVQFESTMNPGAVTQVGGSGVGTVNQHNLNYGMSTWFGISSVSGDCTLCADRADDAALIGSQGDIVLDLAESDVSGGGGGGTAVVPLPAGFALSLTAFAVLGGLGVARRRA